jgi:hypothetical protein
VPDLSITFPRLYLDIYKLYTSMGILVSIHGSLVIKVFCIAKLYFYLFVGSSSVLVADTLVEGS